MIFVGRTRAKQLVEIMAKSDIIKPNDSHATLGHASVGHKLQTENDASVEAVLALAQSDGWAQVTSKPGVTVFRKFTQYPSPPVLSSATNNCGVDGRKNMVPGGLGRCRTSRSFACLFERYMHVYATTICEDNPRDVTISIAVGCIPALTRRVPNNIMHPVWF